MPIFLIRFKSIYYKFKQAQSEKVKLKKEIFSRQNALILIHHLQFQSKELPL